MNPDRTSDHAAAAVLKLGDGGAEHKLPDGEGARSVERHVCAWHGETKLKLLPLDVERDTLAVLVRGSLDVVAGVLGEHLNGGDREERAVRECNGFPLVKVVGA